MHNDRQSKHGKVALVTGAGRGLGLAFAERLAAEGATVIAADKPPAPMLVAELLARGASAAECYAADVSDERQVKLLTEAILEKFGRCDIIVNNAGISPMKAFSELSIQDWRQVMSVNVESMFLVCHALIPAMIGHKYGRIVNIASNTLGLGINGFTHYIASKGAVVGFTRGLASEVGIHGITANCIAPGLTRTPHTNAAFPDGDAFQHFAQAQAIKRPELPEDLVGAMSFLTSDDSAFITGQTLVVDGGLLRSL